jgi:hypothetical protein
MTRIALISDIHANEVALRAVLAEICRTGVDQVIWALDRCQAVSVSLFGLRIHPGSRV